MRFELLVEQKLREAIDNGHFDNLPGAGRPLQSLDDELAGEDWLGLHVLKSNGFLPEWLELRKQIHEGRASVQRAMAEWEAIAGLHGRDHALARRAGEHYRAAAAAINARIDLHNIRCPSIHLEIARFREDAGPMARMEAARASEPSVPASRDRAYD